MQRSISGRDRPFLELLAEMAREAGALILEVRAAGFTVDYKTDHSPVTLADARANAHIVQALRSAFPEIPIVSEEGDNTASSPHSLPPCGGGSGWGESEIRNPSPCPLPQGEGGLKGCFWLVDPLDGTKGFIRGGDEFTVNIGLIHNRQPVAGVIYLPAQDVMYFGSDRTGAFRIGSDGVEQPIYIRVPEGNRRTVIMSRHHPSPDMERLLAPYVVTETLQAASSLKFCTVAEGRADLYPRTGATMEWDTAAGHAILLAAGGQMTTLDGKEFLYGKEGCRNPGFIASA